MKPSLSQAKTAELSIVKGTDMGNGSPVTLRRTQPVQYSLFQQFLPDDHSEDYSNTIELYDAIPKYFSSKKRMAELREGGTFLRHLERRFKHGGKWYTAKILPARLEDTDGQWREYYPSPQEELALQEQRAVNLRLAATEAFSKS
jgi:hypothetical protein